MPPSRRSINFLTDLWRKRGIGACLLFPFALLYAGLSGLRRWLYRHGWLAAERIGVPVVVVGNITSGGTGKTPLVLTLAGRLRDLGRNPGVVSRGYGGKHAGPCEVRPDSDVSLVGDEPLLLRRRGDFPVFVGSHRAAAARALLAAHPECDVIVCDDGLQHYALARDVEIAMLDHRGLMNGLPLPAGPLREPVRRMSYVDAVVLNGLCSFQGGQARLFNMTLAGETFYLLGTEFRTATVVDLAGQSLHAVAGIGDPQRFFDHLRTLGLQFTCHAFPDHHRYVRTDLDFSGDAVLTTEKDAVKLATLSGLPPVWVLPVKARVEPDLARFVLEKLGNR